MKQTEPVSIILPTYNRANQIGKAIESVLAQTYEDFELIVVDDGSTDGGQSRARNCGMKLARYDYLAFEDSDDLWRPGKLKAQMEAMRNAGTNVGMVYHKFRYGLGAGRGMVLPDEKIPYEKKSGDIYAQLLWDNLVGIPTMLLKNVLRQSGDLMNRYDVWKIMILPCGLQKNIRRFFWMRYTLMPVTRFREYQAVTVDSISSQAVCCLQSIRQTILRPILLITE